MVYGCSHGTRSRRAHPAADQARHIEQNSRQREAPGRGEIARSPVRPEFCLVATQAFEVVEALAAARDEVEHALPARGKAMARHTREWRHAEVERAIALRLPPQHRFDQQE